MSHCALRTRRLVLPKASGRLSAVTVARSRVEYSRISG